MESLVDGVLSTSKPMLRHSRVPRDLDSVTDISTREVNPAEVGVHSAGIERIWRAVQRLYRWGMNPAIALCVRRDGQVIIDRSIGHTRGNEPDAKDDADKVTATTDTLFTVASASKAITAMVVHLLDQQGRLHVDDRVCEYIPEFAANGKETITINHVLSHRAGVPNLPKEALDLEMIGDNDHIVDVICNTKPMARPGRRVAYHAISGGFILGEIVRRVVGKPVKDVLAAEILDPLNFEHCNYGVDRDEVDQVAVNAQTGLPVLPPISNLLARALGVPLRQVIETLNDPRFLTGVVPAGNVVCTANELSRFYELLRGGGELDGVRIFEPRTIRRAVSEQSYLEFDLTLGFPFRYGLGFMLGDHYVSLYGPKTEHAFGHLGFTNIISWADPERRVAGALLTSGKPILGPHLYDLYDVMIQIARACPTDGLEQGPFALAS